MFNRKRPQDEVTETSPSHVASPPQSQISNIIPKPSRPDIPGIAPAPAEQFERREPVQETAELTRDADGFEEMSKLIVGRHIHLKGEISSCDLLIVEGRVEASMNSQSLHIEDSGVFEGECSVDNAEIRGLFDGDLLVRQRLSIRSSGRVCGNIQYGEIEIEAGGVIAGQANLYQAAVGEFYDNAEVQAEETSLAEESNDEETPEPAQVASGD